MVILEITVILKFLNVRVSSCAYPIMKIWDFDRIREQATGAGDL
jgi:hypothetical protein